jgi:CheY-like chemotaxis protein
MADMNQSQKKLKILIVDDSPAVSDILSQLCSFLGHEVFSATDGTEALTLLREGIHIDMVFTDYKMPVMDGAEMAKYIKEEYPDLPVVLITGSVVVPEFNIANSNFDAVVQKPFELEAIAQSIDRFFP